MDEEKSILRYEQAAALLPKSWDKAVLAVSDNIKAKAEEFRLRVGNPITIVLPEGERTVDNGKMTISRDDLTQFYDYITEYGGYAATMSNGCVTAPGGFRVGFCGTTVLENGCVTQMRDFSSANLRIAREKIGISDEVIKELSCQPLKSTLIIAPPGAGKTTFLRDMIRNLSNGFSPWPPFRVSVVDERGEIAGMYCGKPQLEIGCHTDVLDRCPKAEGIMMLIRCANPQVIAVDEITAPEDTKAAAMAAHCGVILLATVHGTHKEELFQKPLFASLLQSKIFQQAVVIRHQYSGKRSYQVMDL